MCSTWRSMMACACSRSASGLAALPRHRDRVTDRRERVAQLVRQHGEELVLAPVRLAQRFLGPP